MDGIKEDNVEVLRQLYLEGVNVTGIVNDSVSN